MTELTDYQRDIVESSGQRILIGCRQSGKTETVVQEALDVFDRDGTAIVVSPRYEMLMRLSTRVRQELTNARTTKTEIKAHVGSGRIAFKSARMMEELDSLQDIAWSIDSILIDEANHMPQDALFEIENEFNGDILLTATPAPEKTIVELWAEHSPYWQTTQVGANDVPFLQDHALSEFKTELTNDQELREVEGKIL